MLPLGVAIVLIVLGNYRCLMVLLKLNTVPVLTRSRKPKHCLKLMLSANIVNVGGMVV